MLITCPTCGATYRVDDAAIGPKGRNVQCDACGAQWRQAPPAPPEPVVARRAATDAQEAAADDDVIRIDDDEEDELAEAADAGDDVEAPAARRKTPGLEEAAELLHEMREESERTDALSIFDDEAPKSKRSGEDATEAVRKAMREEEAEGVLSQKRLRSTIASADRGSPNAAEPGGGGFRVGFLLALMVVAVLAFAYLADGLLAAQFPGVAGILETYVAAVDGLRGVVERSAAGVMESAGQ